MKIILALTFAATLTACASPAVVISAATLPGQMHRTSLETQSAPKPEGETVSVTISKYQFFPNANEMDTLCRADILAKYPEIDSTKVNIKHGRNILTGVSNCTATAPRVK